MSRILPLLTLGFLLLGTTLFINLTDLTDPISRLIFWDIRLPRALLALGVGFTLGLSGAALQGYMRNPLAEPALLGISSAASFATVLGFYFGLSSLLIPCAGLLGAGISLLFLLVIAGKHANPMTLLLAGLGINIVGVAATSLFLNLAPNPFASFEITFWLLGSLADRTWDHVLMAFPFIFVGCTLLLTLGRDLLVLTLGQPEAQSLGIHTQHTQSKLIVGLALAVGATVSVAGNIGFVGLLVPHLMRPLAQNRPDRLLLLSGLGGANLTLAADLFVRLVPTKTELSLGVITGLLGAPFFIWLLFHWHQKREVYL